MYKIFAKEIEDGQEGGNIFFKVMSQTDIEKASAFPADKELIMKAVHEGPGPHKLNVAINDLPSILNNSSIEQDPSLVYP